MAVLMAHAYRHAEHRAQLAAAIAKAYIEVRRLQEVLALREALQSPYAGNAEIAAFRREAGLVSRSEEHTSELQSLMRISYAVFCLKKTKPDTLHTTTPP